MCIITHPCLSGLLSHVFSEPPSHYPPFTYSEHPTAVVAAAGGNVKLKEWEVKRPDTTM